MLRFIMKAIGTAAVFLFTLSLIGAEPKQAIFEGESSEIKWPLKELGLPSDWSPFRFLTLELKSSTAQRFELKIYTTTGLRRLRILPFQDAWIRAAVPLAYFERPDQQGFDLASLGNKSRASYWINLSGELGPLKGIEAVGLAMQHPVGKQTLEIRSLRLEQESPGDAVLEKGPLVDEFGQWISTDWPGKARTLADLKKAWAQEEKSLRGAATNCCRFGGYLGKEYKPTGFFRVERIDGRWWFVDPDGHLFFSTGADCMGPWSGTRTEGRDGVFAALPPAELKPPLRRTNPSSLASFYTWNLQRRFGSDWVQPWLDLSVRRMDAWGLNTIACWSDSRLWDAKRKPYTVILRGWGIETGYLGLPDVYAEDFASKVDAAAAEQCGPRKADPYLLGYFVANEPPWPGRESQIVEAILPGPPSPIQRELKNYLSGGDTRERRRAFVYGVVEKFLQSVNAAIRKHDPNHLNFGLRFGFRPPDELLRASRSFDVYSMNSYEFEPSQGHLEAAARITERPILIGEFHFGVPERGLAPSLVQTRDHQERGVAYRYYVEHAAANPAVIGAHWFQWVDEPNTGRMDGENYNCGLLDVTDQPYVELVEAMKTTHRRLMGVHSGKEPPVSRKARIQ